MSADRRHSASGGAAGPLRRVAGGVRIALRVTPRARRNAVSGYAEEADGTRSLRVYVTAPPDGGKANAAVIKLLARVWKLPKSSLTIVSGAADRRKVIEVAGDAGTLAAAIGDWMETAGDGRDETD